MIFASYHIISVKFNQKLFSFETIDSSKAKLKLTVSYFIYYLPHSLEMGTGYLLVCLLRPTVPSSSADRFTNRKAIAYRNYR